MVNIIIVHNFFSCVCNLYMDFWKKTKEISIDYSSNDIIKQGKQPIPNLKIEFDCKRIEDLTSTTYYIWNSGNEVLNNADIVEETLKIECKLDAILDARVIKQSDNSNKFAVLNVTPTNIEILFEYMDSGEGVRLQVLHTGSGENLSFRGKIKGGKAIRNCPRLKKSKGIRAFLKSCISEVFPLFIVFFSLYGAAIVAQLMDLSYKENTAIMMIVSMVATFFILIICIKIKNKVSLALHREVPDDLKQV